jgi:phosphopantothenoylcysteine decarboxylase
MSETVSQSRPVLYLMICAAPPAQQIHEFILLLQANRWDVCAIATPQATRWINIPLLEKLTGHIVRTDYKLPGEADPLPKADAILAMPATFNTINKWAQGIGDTLVTSILCECLGRGTPP